MRAPLLMLALVCACSGETPPTRAATPLADGAPAPMVRVDDRLPGDPTPPAKTDKPPADPRVVAEASDLLKQGVSAYQLGEYDQAEQLLKRSITIYPFLAQANLALGKIFLLRGAAARDEALIDSARLMFDMAHSIDPALREPVMLLELFKPRS